MKQIYAMILISTLSLPVMAAEKYVCNDFTHSTNKLGQNTLVLSPLEDGEITEGKPMAYRLDSYEGADVTEKWSAEGNVLTEDVMFEFTSKNKAINFMIYLDEMNESVLTQKGKKNNVRYICR